MCAWWPVQSYGNVAKIWVEAGKTSYMLRVSLYGEQNGKDVFIGGGCVVYAVPCLCDCDCDCDCFCKRGVRESRDGGLWWTLQLC
jgi:hypothetical protein